MAEEIRIRLTAEGNAKVEIAGVTKELEKVEKSVKDTSKSFGELTKAVVVGDLIASGLKAAAREAIQFAKALAVDSVKAAQAQEDAINNLNSALVLAGDFSAEASQDIQDFAKAMQEASVVGDEVILSQVALAKTFGTTNEQAKELVEAAVNLSAATGITLESAVKNLGKTLGGLTGELGESVPALRQFSQEQLKAGEAIDFVLRRFGGAARDQIATFSGALKQAENTLGDFREEIGSLVTQNTVLNDIIGKSSTFFKDLESTINDNKDTIRDFVNGALVFFINTLGGVIKFTLTFIETIKEAGLFITDLAGGFTLSSEKAKLHIQAMAIARKEQEQLSTAFQQTRETIDKFTDSVNQSVATGQANIESTKAQNEALQKRSDAIKAANEATRVFTEEQKKAAEAGLALAQALGVEGISLQTEAIKAQTELLKSEREAQLITDQEFFLRQSELRGEALAVELQQIEQAEEQKKLTVEQAQQARVLAVQKANTDLAKIDLQRTQSEEKQAQDRLNAQRNSLAGIATLQSSNSKTLFRIGQASAIATATIDGIQSIQKTAAAFPFPVNIPFVAAATAAQAANIAKIASAKPPGLQGGIDEVPQGFQNDTFPALLTTGERVVPSQTNQDLKEFLSNNQGTNQLLVELISAVRQGGNVSVSVGGEELTSVIRRELESGGTLAVEA